MSKAPAEFAELPHRARASAVVRGQPAAIRARPFQAAQVVQVATAARWVFPAASGRQEPALPLAESVVQRAAPVVRPQGAGHAEAALQPAVAARAVVVLRRAAEPRAGAAVLRPEVVRQEARGAAAVRLRVVPDARVARPWVLPSAGPWVFRRDQPLPWPAPRPAVRFAHAMQCLQIALP